MQNVSALYQQILDNENHWYEHKLRINGIDYTVESLRSVSTTSKIFEDVPTIGRAVSAEIDVEMLNPSVDIPTMARMELFVRACDAENESEWLPQGVFRIDTRQRTKTASGLSILKIHGFDEMLKAEQAYPDSSHEWPYQDILVVNEIAAAMGVQVDARTTAAMNMNYTIPLPAGYTMREVLGFIASMYVGSFIITEEGKLRLITLLELPPETNLLIDQLGNPIVFGEDRILV